MQLDVATHWYHDMINFLASDIIPSILNYQQKKSFNYNAKAYFWNEPYLYKKYPNQFLRRYIVEGEVPEILKHCRASLRGRHLG